MRQGAVTYQVLDAFAIDMRFEDEIDLLRLGYGQGAAGLRKVMAHTVEATAFFTDDGQPLFIVGLTEIANQDIHAWAAGTLLSRQHPVACARASKNIIDRFRKNYQAVRTIVAKDNETSLRWLKWLGFQIGGASPYGDGMYLEAVLWRSLP